MAKIRVTQIKSKIGRPEIFLRMGRGISILDQKMVKIKKGLLTYRM